MSWENGEKTSASLGIEYVELKEDSNIQVVNDKNAPLDLTITSEMQKNILHFKRKLAQWAMDPIYSTADDGYANELLVFNLLKRKYSDFDVLPTPIPLDLIPRGAGYPSADIMIGTKRGNFFRPAVLIATAVKSESGSGYHNLVGSEVVSLTGASIFRGKRYSDILVEFGISGDAEKLVNRYVESYGHNINLPL